jgi:hypothetical protein
VRVNVTVTEEADVYRVASALSVAGLRVTAVAETLGVVSGEVDGDAQVSLLRAIPGVEIVALDRDAEIA